MPGGQFVAGTNLDSKGLPSMYPVTIPGVADSFEEPPPLPHDSPPGRDLAKLQRSRSSGDASHRQRKSSSGQTSKPRSKAELTSEGGRVSCPEASRVVPQVSSPRSKKRRHRGRHRHHHSDLGPEDFRLNIPTNKPDATNGSTAPTLVPPSSSRGADSGDLSKSAPCDTWCLTDLDNGAEARSPEPRSTDKVDNRPFRLRSCTSPDYFSSMDQSRPSCRSWYNRACPFFATSLTGDDNAAEERGMPVPHPTIHGPSAYIPVEELPSLGTFNEQVMQLFSSTLTSPDALSSYCVKQWHKIRRFVDYNVSNLVLFYKKEADYYV
ncbi:uncharacterized protein [Periplaneta americana]|uniref:uncharacterized protein n=1 Tax=Periplaneta americana TaxID=6978 RepID=UPI0037E7DB79